MTTAAEKLGMIPPWAEIKDGPGGKGFWVHHVPGEFVCINTSGAWTTSKAKYYATYAEAAIAASLTRPLESWEPAPDCPLPVEGWIVNMGLPSREWCVVDGGGTIVRSGFPTRAAAYVWAWTKAEHTPGTGAKDGPDSRGVLGWAAFDELCKTVDAVESRVVDRVSKVEGVLAKIGPIESFIAEAQALANRMTIVERLVAAQVDKPAKLNAASDAASTNEAMTEAAAVDDTTVVDPCEDYERALEAVPPTYRVGDDLAAWVRNLAAAHAAALKDMAEYRTALDVANHNFARITGKLAAAHEATRQAEARCANAVRRATEAESKLAELRAQLEAALT